MNPNAASSLDDRPRLICRIVRQGCVFSDRRPAHVNACPSCLAYFQAEDAFENSLRTTAGHARRELPSSPDFEDTILRAVRSSTPNPDRSHRHAPNRTWVFGGLSAAAAIAVVALALNIDPPSRPAPRSASASTAEDAAIILNTVETLSTELVGTVIPSAGHFVADNPLQQELGYVYSDVRSALDFLALNFLPAAPTQPASPERSRSI